MTKIKTISTTVLLFAVVAAPVFAQDGGEPGNRYGWVPNNSANSERPRPYFNTEDFGMRNSDITEPGDFAVTGGERSRAWNPTGQVDPDTSNSPAGNAGGE